MDNKQKQIYDKILDKYDLPHENTFVQHRNLKEFRYFFIERINPNHRIFLYGKFKKSMPKSNHFPNKIIKVGEILLYSMFFLIPVNNWFLDIELKILSLLCITKALYELCLNDGIEKLNIYIDRYKCLIKKEIAYC